MPRTFYSDYVRHCIRFYVKYPKPFFYNNVGRQNWKACEKALKGFSEQEKRVLSEVYICGDTLINNVFQVSEKQGVESDSIWRLMHKFERKIAKERGLI